MTLAQLVHLAIPIVVVGIILGLINRYIPMAGSIKSLLNGIVIIFVVLWVLQQLGVLGSLGGMRLH